MIGISYGLPQFHKFRVLSVKNLDLVSKWRKTRRQGHQKRKLRMYWAKNGIIAWLIR